MPHKYKVTVHNEPIPKNRMRQFHEILVEFGGVYLTNPRDCGDEFRVDYAPGDYHAHSVAWRRVTTPIKESRADGLFHRVWRRFLAIMKGK